MEYVDELKNFKELYNMFYNGEPSVFLDTVKELHLEETYMEWLNAHFKDTVPAKSTIADVITHEWDDFRMHIPYLTLSECTTIMEALVASMDDIERVEALKFPMTFSEAELPSQWASFAKEVYDYALPIKVEINVSDTKAYVITVMHDFREVFEERQVKKNA